LALSLGYALGMGILGQLMLPFGWLDLSLSKEAVSLAILIYMSFISFLFLLRLRYFPHKNIDLPKGQEGSWTTVRKLFFVIMLAYISCQAFYILWNAFFVPICHGDDSTAYLLRTRMFLHTHSLRQLWGISLVGHLSYPLQNPLAMAWVALNIGQWHEGWVRMIFPLNCFSFVGIVYYFMKRWTDRLTALLTVALMLSSLFFVYHASIGYCDFTEMFYTVSSLLLISWGISSRCAGWILLGGLMSAFAASVKLEGIAYWILEGVVLCRFILAKEFFDPQFVIKALAGFVLPFIIIECNFGLYKAHYGIAEIWKVQHYFVFSLHEFGGRIPAMACALTDNFFLSGNWNILWFFLIVMVLANLKKKKSFAFRFFSLTLGLFFMNYLLAAEFTNKSIFIADVKNVVTLSRLLLHFFPLCPILIGLLMYHFLENKRV